MLRQLCAVLLAIASGGAAASAATLTITPDKLTYNVGETITLIVFGDSEGATTYGTFGRLLYSGALVDNGTRTQRPASGGTILSSLNAGDNGIDAYSDAFNRISLVPGPLSPGTLSTVTLIAQAIGVVNVNWDEDVLHGIPLDFFGLTTAPGTSFTIVPEPTTATLLVLGLLGLAGWRRVRA